MRKKLSKVSLYSCYFVGLCTLISCDQNHLIEAHCDPACPEGEVCINGVCEEQTGDGICEDTGCPEALVCVGGVCREPSELECLGDNDCDSKEKCEDGVCVENTDCTENSCGEGYKCVLGDCIALTCQDTGCEDGFVCVSNRCEKIDPCLNKICDKNYICENGVCNPVMCGDITCGATQTCYRDVCYEDEEFCGLEICTYSQKCVNDACVPLDACDSTVCPESQTCALNVAGLPVCYSAACMENGSVKVCAEGQSCVAGACVDSQIDEVMDCPHGYLDETGQCIVPLKSVVVFANDMEISQIDVLLDSSVQLNVKYIPENTTERGVVWTTQNITPTATTETTDQLVTLEGQDTESLKMTGISTYAGEIKLTVQSTSRADVTSSVKVDVKPYFALRPGDVYKDYKTFKKGKLKCKYYDEYNLAVFNRDLYEKFVQPKMIAREEEGKLVYYPTRASVVAAVRFLSMQFPWTFPYRMYSLQSHTMISHFVWTKHKKAENPDDVRIYGLNLTNNVYNSHENDRVIYEKSTPWACTYSDKAAGLECSGFVAWALRNGRFDGGDWKTSMFSSDNYKTASETAAWGFNGNNVHDHVIEKFTDLDRKKDFIKYTKITEDQVHAGDLLWHGTYTKDNGDTGSGHVAIIAGVKRKEDGSIQYVYVSEASSYGNGMTRYSWSDFKSASKWKNDKYTSYLIRMDNVYKYATKKYGLELDSNAYDDFW